MSDADRISAGGSFGPAADDQDDYPVQADQSAPEAKPASEARPAAGPAGGGAPGVGAAKAWYVALPTGQREGPQPEVVVKQRLAVGSMSPDTLVWREGMPAWAAARSMPELFEPRPAPQPAAGPQAAAPPPPMPAALPRVQTDYLRLVNDWLANPMFYRLVGWAAAGLAALFLVESILLFYWEKSWFTGVFVFVLIFLVGQATATVLEKLQRLESRLPKEEDKTRIL